MKYVITVISTVYLLLTQSVEDHVLIFKSGLKILTWSSTEWAKSRYTVYSI